MRVTMFLVECDLKNGNFDCGMTLVLLLFSHVLQNILKTFHCVSKRTTGVKDLCNIIIGHFAISTGSFLLCFKIQIMWFWRMLTKCYFICTKNTSLRNVFFVLLKILLQWKYISVFTPHSYKSRFKFLRRWC